MLWRTAILILDLGPAGDAGPNQMAHTVVGNLLAQPFHELGALRTRTHESHVAFEHAPQLGNFIEAGRAQKRTNSCDSRIIVGGPCRAGIGFRVLTHGPELVAMKQLAPKPDPPLAIQNRA